MMEINDLATLRAEHEALKAFARELMRDRMGTWDGGDLQDLGIKHCLLEYYAAPADNDCDCEEPEAHKCVRLARILTREVG